MQKTLDEIQHLEFLSKIAYWYYEENLEQSEIAKRIHKSRSMVSRLLREARENGLIEISIKLPLSRNLYLEKDVCRTFQLGDTWVLSNKKTDLSTHRRSIGLLASQYLQRHLKDGVQVGIGWGKALSELVRSMPDIPLKNTSVVQIIGAVGYGDPWIEGFELARSLAQKLDSSYRFLSAPVLMESEIIAQALIQERSIAETIEMARNVDVAIVGIGDINPATSTMYRAGYLTDEDIAVLLNAGSVGEILARQLDKNGNELNLSVNRRVVGLDLAGLKNIPTVIAVAFGHEKVEIIKAVLSGGLINALITDEETAAALLAYA